MKNVLATIVAIVSLVWAVNCQALERKLDSGLDDGQSASPREYLRALGEADAAVAYIWDQMPFLINKALLVTKPCKVYGDFEPRNSAVFSDNDPTLAYVEPLGFKFRQVEDGFFELGLAVDLLILDSQGKIVVLQDDYEHLEQRSRYQLREVFINVSLPLFGLPPDEYHVSIKVRDLIGKGSATTKLRLILR